MESIENSNCITVPPPLHTHTPTQYTHTPREVTLCKRKNDLQQIRLKSPLTTLFALRTGLSKSPLAKIFSHCHHYHHPPLPPPLPRPLYLSFCFSVIVVTSVRVTNLVEILKSRPATCTTSLKLMIRKRWNFDRPVINGGKLFDSCAVNCYIYCLMINRGIAGRTKMSIALRTALGGAHGNRSMCHLCVDVKISVCFLGK